MFLDLWKESGNWSVLVILLSKWRNEHFLDVENVFPNHGEAMFPFISKWNT